MVEIKRPYSVLLAGQPVAMHWYCDPYQKVYTGSAIVCGLVAGTSVQLPSQDNPADVSAMPECRRAPPLGSVVSRVLALWILVVSLKAYHRHPSLHE